MPPPSARRSPGILAADLACVAAACAGAILLGLALLDGSAYGRFLVSLLVR